MITQLEKYLNQQPQSNIEIKPNHNRTRSRSSVSPSRLRRSELLLRLPFNLSKGHYNFVSELLKSKLDGHELDFDIDVNETIKNEHLQYETNHLSKKFLYGKTTLILCSYLNENEWAISICRLLIQTGAKVSLKDQCNGCTALHYACAMLKTELILILLRNVNFSLDNLRDHNGNSPLFYLLASYAERPELNEHKIYDIFKTFFNYLKHYNIKINIQNRYGLSLYGLWDFLVSNYKNLENNEVFIYVGQVLKQESPSLKESSFWRTTPLRLSRTTSQLEFKTETDSEYYSMTSSRISIENFLRRHLLIETKNVKPITHSIKIDNYLLYMFLDKVTPNNIPVNFSLIRDKSGLDTEIYRKNINIPVNMEHSLNEEIYQIRSKKLTWRDRFNQLYNSLEIKNSESYRTTVKYVYENKNEHHNHHHGHHHSNPHLNHHHAHEEHSLPQISHRAEAISSLSHHSGKKHKSNSLGKNKNV